MGKSSLAQQPKILGNGSRAVGDQNQHNPIASSRKGSPVGATKHPVGKVGQSRSK